MHNYCWFSLVGKKQKAEGDFLEWLCDRLARLPFSGDSVIVALFLATWFSGKDPLPWCLSLAARAELWLKRAASRDRCLKYSFNLLLNKAPAVVFTFIFIVFIHLSFLPALSTSGSQCIQGLSQEHGIHTEWDLFSISHSNMHIVQTATDKYQLRGSSVGIQSWR